MRRSLFHWIWIAPAFLLALPLVALAGEPLDLSGLVHTALENSPIIQKAEAQKNEGKWKRAEGISQLLPTLTINASHFLDKKYQVLNVPFGGGPTLEIPQIFPSSSASLNARWTLFDGLANVNLFKSGLKAASAAEAKYEWEKFQIEADVTLAYSRVLAAQALAAVAQSNLKTLENHFAQVKSLKEGGLATHYDVLKVESQLSEARVEELQSQDNIAIALNRLTALIGKHEPIEVKNGALESPSDSDVKHIENLAKPKDFGQRKDLESLQFQSASADAIDAAATFFWSPRLYLGANYIQYNNLTDTLSNWAQYRTAWDVGLFVSWSIFAPKDFASAKQSQYRAVALQKELEQANLQAPVDFEFWKRRYLYSASLYRAKNTDLVRATETVRLAEAGFKAGVRTTTEVLDAELELFRARAGIVNAQINCIEAKLKLELANGAKL